MSDVRAVAIVGMGPKGLYALERLLWHHRGGVLQGVAVDVWDPGGQPGVGPVYHRSQPEYLTMNQPAGDVDIWWPDNGVVPKAQRKSFAQWSGRDRDEYAPRAEVGRYLADGYALLLRHAPRGVTVRHRQARAEQIVPDGGGWSLEGAREHARYDDVLLTTGHNDHIDPASVADRDGPVRGFALTFIDVALAASEGRGGRFETTAEGVRYLPPTEHRPALWPFSRTGRPMLPKPEPVVAEGVAGLGAIAEHGQARLEAARPPVRVDADLLPIVTETADRMLRAASGGGESPSSSRMLLVAQMKRDLAVATGRARPDRAWALGQAWRSLYPRIVTRAAGDHLAAVDRPAFRRLAADMERLAFGPSPVNAAKLVALVEAGLVRLDGVRALPSPGTAVANAVIAPPGIAGDRLLEQLRRARHVRAIAGGRGVEVTADGTCVSADGIEQTGLAAYGRPTEDAVIGNDTLSRTLHPVVDRWAASVATRGHRSELAA